MLFGTEVYNVSETLVWVVCLDGLSICENILIQLVELQKELISQGTVLVIGDGGVPSTIFCFFLVSLSFFWIFENFVIKSNHEKALNQMKCKYIDLS